MTDAPDIAVSISCPAWEAALPTALEVCEQVATITLDSVSSGWDGPPLERAEVSIVLADDDSVQALNRAWRGQDKPTNVLSFAALDDEDAPLPDHGPIPFGDVIVAFETTKAEAEAEGKTLAQHLSHLVVHGVLHLLGYDHEDDDEACEMERLETAILAVLGIPDPYADADAEEPLADK